jgi:hypothetical protein
MGREILLMKIRSILQAVVAVSVLATAHMASAQVTSTSGEVKVNEAEQRTLLAEGVMRVNGVLYIVSAGIARPINLADGQMATMGGVVREIPPNATLPGGIPQATLSTPAAGTPATGTAVAPATANPTTIPGRATPQSERNRNAGDPSPGATTPSSR